MPKVIFGNHAALRLSAAERERIQSFYRDVLGCKLNRSFPTKDDFLIGEDHTISFLYGGTGDGAPDNGATYAPDDALGEDEFLKAIFLELKTDDVETMRREITKFGVRVLAVPDSHLYFQAPGGQVFRLVGIDEDLSKYEG